MGRLTSLLQTLSDLMTESPCLPFLPRSPWQRELGAYNTATNDADKRRHLREMVRLANNCWRANDTMNYVCKIRRPGVQEDTDLLRTIIYKVVLYTENVFDLTDAWLHAPDGNTRHHVFTRMGELVEQRPQHAFFFRFFLVNHFDEITWGVDVTSAHRDMIHAIATADQAHLALKRLRNYPDLRPEFWRKITDVVHLRHEALALHHSWLTDEEERNILHFASHLCRDMGRCPEEYRRACSNTACPLAQG